MSDAAPSFHCRLCGRGPSVGPPPDEGDIGNLHPWGHTWGPVHVSLPDQPMGFPSEHQVPYACLQCYLKNKEVHEKRPVPFAIYGEQTDISGDFCWKDCAMCGLRAFSSSPWCWRCVDATRHESFKERTAPISIDGIPKVAPQFLYYPQHAYAGDNIIQSRALRRMAYEANPQRGSFKIHGFGV